jgi:hypothetical protein
MPVPSLGSRFRTPDALGNSVEQNPDRIAVRDSDHRRRKFGDLGDGGTTGERQEEGDRDQEPVEVERHLRLGIMNSSSAKTMFSGKHGAILSSSSFEVLPK